MANLFLTIAHTSLFSPSGPTFIAKNHQRVVYMRVCSIRIFALNMGDPYYEPQILQNTTTYYA